MEAGTGKIRAAVSLPGAVADGVEGLPEGALLNKNFLSVTPGSTMKIVTTLLLNELDEDLAHEGLSREKIEDEIIKIVLENQDSNKATGLGEVGSRLVSLYPDFDVRSYGYNMLSKFLEQFSRIQLVKHGHIINVALRENAGQKEVIDAYVLNLVRSAGKDGMELSMIGNKVYEKNKDFKIRDYGYAQFNKYVKSLDKICVTQEGAQMIARYVK